LSERQYDFQFLKDAGERLDKFLVEELPELSRSRIQALIAEALVQVDGMPARKAGQIVEKGQTIRVRIPPAAPVGLLAEQVPLDIIFENADMVVVNKPAGMVVHPAAGHSSGTLVNAALGYDPEFGEIGGEERPGVVHRLDKDTSGLILLARNDAAHRWLQDQFRLRKVDKTYLALVDGKPPTPTGRVEAPIGRDPAHRKRMAILVPGKGREAVSEYKTLENFRAHTLLEFHPLTGRTHQIRLHCEFLGCPIAGDRVYGRKSPSIELGRQFLHAARLKITLPGEAKPRQFEAPLPAELQAVLDKLRTQEKA
jgi:23S rRNA pseudouridine1911/1915/1917 synthase